MSEGRVSICNDVAREEPTAPWREAATRAGLHSLGGFPLRCQGQIVGAVTLCSAEIDFFRDREISLLEELATDISFALDHLETEARRQRSEENIRRNEAELEAIYDSTPLMICLVNRQRVVERMNRTMSEFVGGPSSINPAERPGDLLGCVNALDDPRGCGFGARAKPARCVWPSSAPSRPAERTRHVESKLVLVRDGVRREIQVFASTALVRLQSQPKVLVCLEDVSGRKQLEAQLLQAQKMDAIGQLAGGIAHDFNNILAATLLHLQLLRQNQSLDPEMLASLGELEQGTQRAANLTRQLLLFSRREVMQIKRVDFNDVIRAMMKMLGRTAGRTHRDDVRPKPATGLAGRRPRHPRADGNEPLHQRSRCHAPRRSPQTRRAALGLEGRRPRAARPGEAWSFRLFHRDRHRLRHGRSHAQEDVRAVFHHETIG